jgi:DUF917 family protein
MRKLTLQDLEDLAIGSTILGSGGGGNPCYPYMAARYRSEQCGLVSLISLSELDQDQIVMPIGFMGTSLVEMERLPSGREFEVMFEKAEKALGRKIDAVMPFEIGGGNAFIPIAVASQMGLPVVDADTMGRAFPEAQMSSYNLYEWENMPGFVTDILGNTVVIYASNASRLERIGRQITIAMGSDNAFCLYPMTGKQAQKRTLPKTLSKAISIGKAHRVAKMRGQDPLKAILDLLKGVCICSGKIVDVDHSILKGFSRGKVVIQGQRNTWDLMFQNEYLAVKANEKIVATTPDILMLLEQETGTPISNELLQYGLKVNLIALPAPSIWTTPEGLALVGPRHFGYEIDYQPAAKSMSASSRHRAKGQSRLDPGIYPVLDNRRSFACSKSKVVQDGV